MAYTETIIECVKKYPILYDPSHEDYKNTSKKNKVWEQMGVELGEKGNILKKKWRNLRDSYLRHLKTKMCKSGEGGRNKRWGWAKKMQVFRPYMPIPETADGIDDVVSCKEEQLSQFIDSNSNDNWLDYEEKEDPLFARSIPSPSESSASSRKKKNGEGEFHVSEGNLIPCVRIQQRDMDELDLLFAAHAKNVQKFSPKRKAITKLKIAELLMEQELLDIEEKKEQSFCSLNQSALRKYD